MKLDTIPHLEINRKIEKIIQKYNPEIVYTTPASDFNKDHKIVNESTVIATRTTLNQSTRYADSVIGYYKFFLARITAKNHNYPILLLFNET